MVVACSVQVEILKFLLQDYSEQLAASQYVLVGSAKAFLGQETFPANPSPLGKPITIVNPSVFVLKISYNLVSAFTAAKDCKSNSMEGKHSERDEP